MEKWSRLGDEERGGKQGIRQPRQLAPRIIGFQGLQICRDKANVDASHLPRSFRTSSRFLLRPTFRNPYTSMPSRKKILGNIFCACISRESQSGNREDGARDGSIVSIHRAFQLFVITRPINLRTMSNSSRRTARSSEGIRY